MYAIGITLCVVGIMTCVIGMFMIVQARVPAPVEHVATTTTEATAEVTPEEEPAPFYEPGTLVMVEDKAYQADTATIPGFMYTMWKAQMIETGVKILHEQDMGNGLMTVAALVPQEKGACGHAECQPGYEAPPSDGHDDEPGTGGMYL